MPQIVLASIDDVNTSSTTTLNYANNYTEQFVPEKLAELLKKYFPIAPSEASNIGWDFQIEVKNDQGQSVKQWKFCPTVEYVDQLANLSLDICNALIESGNSKTLLDAKKYLDSSKETIIKDAHFYTDSAFNIAKSNLDTNIEFVKKMITSIQKSQFLEIEDILDAMDRIDLN